MGHGVTFLVIIQGTDYYIAGEGGAYYQFSISLLVSV